ncbi:ABC transporter permease [Haloferula sp. BvORR071]|uniref:MlaE family ABC transporter permease n=1 Tax=Haloferula sp. BvORR071 TaxID=1396141 RepID=UPI0009DE9B74|nr:ABC transporter permease [Haloferula sp. BvORR071]
MGFFRFIGSLVTSFLEYLGEVSLLIRDIAVSLVKGKIRWWLVMQQIVEIGYRSQPVVMITGAFTGAVLAAQSLFQFSMLGMETGAGALVSVAMLRELGPTITALMLAGRVGAAMAAEIGTMRVTEQVDALRSMGVHPVDYLVSPRLLAMLFAVPLLIGESAALGIGASVIVGTGPFNVNAAYWMDQMGKYTDLTDVLISLIKGVVFGVLIVCISCHQGMSAKDGAVGVGRSTTRAMVYSALAILIFNFFLTLVLNVIFPAGLSRH